MKYGLCIVLILAALTLGALGTYFGQLGFDIAGVLVGLAAVGVFLWSSLHFSLQLRPLSRHQTGPRDDKEQAALLGSVIFDSKQDPGVD
ncbi:MAG: hypothetical protein NVSMB44_30170 [Ktedonobacteraceae bacterium]